VSRVERSASASRSGHGEAAPEAAHNGGAGEGGKRARAPGAREGGPDPIQLPPAPDSTATTITPLREARRQFERHYVLAVLERCGWRIAAAARALGLQRPNFYRKARQLNISLRPPDTGHS
jgi:two-component system nitrogen regulation response regulator NtrX